MTRITIRMLQQQQQQQQQESKLIYMIEKLGKKQREGRSFRSCRRI